jgi:hypothetical protein
MIPNFSAFDAAFSGEKFKIFVKISLIKKL